MEKRKRDRTYAGPVATMDHIRVPITTDQMLLRRYVSGAMRHDFEAPPFAFGR